MYITCLQSLKFVLGFVLLCMCRALLVAIVFGVLASVSRKE